MLNEARFLAQQSARCRARLQQHAAAWREDTLAALDLRAAIRHRPWWSLAGAAGSGFLAGALLGRRKRPAALAAPVHGLWTSALRRAHVLARTALEMVTIAGLRTPKPPAADPDQP